MWCFSSRAILVIFYLACLASSCTAVTLEEIRLMLRSGFSSETIIQEELLRGKVYGRFNAQWEKEFRALNASPKLIEALKSRKYVASESEQHTWDEDRARQRLLPTASQIEGERIVREAAAINQKRRRGKGAFQGQVTVATNENSMSSSFAGPLQVQPQPPIASTPGEQRRREIEDETASLRSQNIQETQRRVREIEEQARSEALQYRQAAETTRREIAERTRLLKAEGERMRQQTQRQATLLRQQQARSPGR